MTLKMTATVVVMLLAGASLMAQKQGYKSQDRGNASYYSDKLHGRKMANGQKYDRNNFTCAHLKYPLGTMLKVRNLKNGKECVVKVTDRGPYSRKFIIDLSWAAAKYLGILGAGFMQVEITPQNDGQFPWKPGVVEPEMEMPELDLDYEPAAIFPVPAWQADSVDMMQKKPAKTTKSTSTTTTKGTSTTT